ncbi:MAG: hypothetical protein B6I31_03215 [Desulfobacteraceae bacterium 4572_19]|nr:MAG: hypothetical protein B6I31_03215 [Desulfobacteraceae bacterium 4572_19]
MAVFESNKFTGHQPVTPPHSAGEQYLSDAVADVPATHVVGDIIKLCVLPFGCRPTDFTLVSESLDSGTAIRVSVGRLNDAGDDLVADTEFITTGNLGSDALIRATLPKGFLNILPEEFTDQTIAIKITTGASGAIAGKVRGILSYRATEWGI